MSAGSFKMQGWEKVQRQLGQLAKGVPQNVLRDILHEGGQLVADEARRLAPYLTGLLRDSILVVDANDARVYGKVNAGGASVYVGPVGSVDDGDVYYARFQEFGTRNMEANPFMRPAIATKRPQAEKLIAARLSTYVTAQAR